MQGRMSTVGLMHKLCLIKCSCFDYTSSSSSRLFFALFICCSSSRTNQRHSQLSHRHPLQPRHLGNKHRTYKPIGSVTFEYRFCTERSTLLTKLRCSVGGVAIILYRCWHSFQVSTCVLCSLHLITLYVVLYVCNSTIRSHC